jgi:hypothetical protein
MLKQLVEELEDLIDNWNDKELDVDINESLLIHYLLNRLTDEVKIFKYLAKREDYR